MAAAVTKVVLDWEGFIARTQAVKRQALSKVTPALGTQAKTLISAMADTSVFYTERLFQSGNQSLVARLEPHKHTTGTRLRYWHRGITVYMA